MSDYRFQVVKHNDIACLHVMIDGAEQFDGFVQAYIPLDEIMRDAAWRGQSIATVGLGQLARRLDALEMQLGEQGINDLARAIERRIVSRLRYGRDPRIEVPK
jgi:hypothetical protein